MNPQASNGKLLPGSQAFQGSLSATCALIHVGSL